MALEFLLICNGLANPYEATVVLFSTMIKSIHAVFNEATGHFIISSSFHHFFIISPFHHFITSSFHLFIISLFHSYICSFLRSVGRGGSVDYIRFPH